jgi:hypothetical protein
MFQANSVELELKKTDKKIAMEQEINKQHDALDQATAVEDFLRTK